MVKDGNIVSAEAHYKYREPKVASMTFSESGVTVEIDGCGEGTYTKE